MTDAIVLEEKSLEEPPPPPPAKVSPPPKMSRRAQAARRRRLIRRLKRAIQSKGPEFKRWRSVVVTLGDRRFVAWRDVPAAVKEKDFAGARIRLGTILPCWGIQHLAYSLGKEGSQAKHTGKAARERKSARRLWKNPTGMMAMLAIGGAALSVMGALWGCTKKAA